MVKAKKPIVTAKAKAHFKEDMRQEVKGPFAGIIVSILAAFLPKIIEWIFNNYDVYEKTDPNS